MPGEYHVTTFDPTGSTPGQMVVFSASGRLLRQVTVAQASPQLLGIAFHPATGDLLVIDFGPVLGGGNGRVLKVDPVSGASSVFMTATGGAGLNALTFDASGNVYVSDSFQGFIWKTGPSGGRGRGLGSEPASVHGRGAAIRGNGFGIQQGREQPFVANTGDDTVVRFPVNGGTAGTPSVFVNSINGADGLLIDRDDNLWVAANQANEIVVVDPSGRAIAKLGDFDGIDPHGAAVGLLFPASLVESNGFLYVTNLALDLRLSGLPRLSTRSGHPKSALHDLADFP